MKYLLLCCMLLFSIEGSTQENGILRGQVQHQNSPVQNVHIKNVSTGTMSTTETGGRFRISASPGDTLVFTHLSLHDHIEILPEEEGSPNILVQMKTNSNELGEVVLDERNRINAVNLGIIKERPKALSLNERRLETAGDFKPIHLLGLLVGSFEVDPLLNAINGRTKRLKRNIRVEKRRETINLLLDRHADYLRQNTDLSEAELHQFMDYVADKEELSPLLSARNEGALNFFLFDQWVNFRKLEPLEQE